MSDTPPSKPPSPTHSIEPEPTPRKEIPLTSVPNDEEMMADDMAELFDEDRVTHKHGNSEPEAD